jgi:sugar/nucleoside kinase (ribokinase family)
LDTGALAPLLRALDVFLPNEAEMAMLQKAGLGDQLAKLTVVKRGASGAQVFSAEGVLSAPAFPTDVIDTTGAGDAFNAGFLSRWLMDAPLIKCLEAGNHRGALAVATRGGFSANAVSASALDMVGE